MYKHTLLIDNGFGSRQCLLSGFIISDCLFGRPFDHPLRYEASHQYSALWNVSPDHLLFFLIGFVVFILYHTKFSLSIIF